MLSPKMYYPTPYKKLITNFFLLSVQSQEDTGFEHNGLSFFGELTRLDTS